MYESFAIFYTHIFLFYLEEKYCQMTSMAAGLVKGRNNTSRKERLAPKSKSILIPCQELVDTGIVC